MPVFWWLGLDFVFLGAGPHLVVCFGGVYELIMILGSLSANGWGCVPVLLVIWHGASALELAGHWVELGLSTEMEIFGRALAS